ncbi:hypothetical protein GN958_ATG18517, partial [Phytophthora infestans]
CNEWELEEGYPCSHRNLRQYKTKAEDQSRRIMEHSRWLQYVHYYFAGVRLSRSKEDLCDACTRIETLQLNPDIPDSERTKLVAEKEFHLDAAINQRRAMSAFVKQYVAQKAPKQTILKKLSQI